MGLNVIRVPRVVLVTPKYPPIPSGYGNQAYSVTNRLMNRVSIWLATPDGQPVDIAAAHKRAVSVPHTPRNVGYLELGAWITKTCAWLIRNRRKYDIIHVLGGYYWALPFVVVGKFLGKGTIVKIVSGEIDLAVHNTLNRRLRISLLRRATVLVVLTEHTRRTALSLGFKPEQLRHIPNGVDIERFANACHDRAQLRVELGIPDDSFVVLFVGQVGRRKGVDRLLAAWRAFHRSALGPIRLILVGEPDGSVDLNEITNTEDVSLVGHVNEPERYYGVADCFVLLSRSEGMANVVLEATAAGIPTIVSSISPNRELASRLGGIVASGNDDQMISEAAAYLRKLERAFREQSPVSRNESGQRVVRTDYSLASIADRYITLYRGLSE